MVVTVIVNHPLHVPFSITHPFLFATTLGPFQPALYLRTTTKKGGVPLEDNHVSMMVVSLYGMNVLL
jgi:hypothetical protein